MHGRVGTGALFEHVLRQIKQAGELGRFRTPRHVIRTVVEMIAPQVGETVCDPAAGTAGFLVAAYNHMRLAYASPSAIFEAELNDKRQRRGLCDQLSAAQVHTATFSGNDVDSKMVRLATNLTLRGLPNERIRLPSADFPVRVEPGAHRSAANGQPVHDGQCPTQCRFGQRQLGVVAAEVLAEGIGAAPVRPLSETHLQTGPERPDAVALGLGVGSWPEVADDDTTDQPVAVDRLLPTCLHTVVGGGYTRALQPIDQALHRQQPLFAESAVGPEQARPLEALGPLRDRG